MGLLDGKKGLILNIANDRSIAAYIGGGISFHPSQMVAMAMPVARSARAIASPVVPSMKKV